MSDEKTENLLNGSNKQLTEYRNIQSKKLQLRLNIFTKAVKDKFGNFENIKERLSGPVESEKDIELVSRIINLKTFAIIPVFANDTDISHCYTIGMWYYWGLPEIVLNFDKPLTKNIEFINIIVNIIHDKLFMLLQDKINKNETDINRIDYELEDKEIELKIDSFDLQFNLKRVDDDYMGIKALFLMWFYMYYMDAIVNNNGEPKLYPVYQISIDNDYYDEVCKKIIDKLKNRIVDPDSDSDLSTIDEDDEN